MEPLAQIESFGGIDADTDALLEACFQDHEAYREAVSHTRFVILGRKGSGKTAIYRKLIRTREHDVFAFGHTFSDYPWPHHHLQGSIAVPEEQRYVHSWQYLILLTVAKILLNKDQSQPWNVRASEELTKLKSFMVDSYGSRDPDVTELFSPTKTLRIHPHLKITQMIDVGVDLESFPMSELPKVFQDVNRTIATSVATCLNPNHHYYVCFDELDRGFDPSDNLYSQMLVGLILAARAITQQIRDAGKHFSVVVFLRDDIYELLRFEDKNKVTENLVSTIEWDSPRTKWSLKNLMERRFGTVVSQSGQLAWDRVFDETQEMTGRQSKYQHILDRTFRRPRDIIKFCNEILAAYKVRGGDGDRFTNEDIIAARASYSEYLLRELDDEIHKHVPKYEDYLELLKSIGALQFSRPEFDAACDRRGDLVPGGVRPVDMLRKLFEFSVVSYQKTGGVGGGSEYMWRYIEPRIRFDEAATNFRVHPGFMEAFGLKKFRRIDAARE